MLNSLKINPRPALVLLAMVVILLAIGCAAGSGGETPPVEESVEARQPGLTTLIPTPETNTATPEPTATRVRSAGPLAQVVLADEINRATPKTQSALLEAMEEHQVTVDGVTHHLEAPFLVMATQNPIEYEGTFPLPEAQLDRFLMRISLGYPDFQEELSIIEHQEQVHPIDSLEAVASPREIIGLQEAAKAVYVDDLVRQYIVGLIEATRNHREISLGASPRASLGLFRAVRALALVRDRDYVIPDDAKLLAPSVIAHRIVLSPSARMRGIQSSDVIADLLGNVAVPGTTR